MPDIDRPSREGLAGASSRRLTLVLGGARSGKSRYAENLIEQAGDPAIYLATAEARDDEMAARIVQHRARRGTLWTTVEEPVELVNTLMAATQPVLVDCLTLWLSNLLGTQRDVGFEIERLLSLLPRIEIPVVMVANEVGLGIVPDNPLARRFRDDAGRLNQGVAAGASHVVFMAAGLPLTLKE